MDINGCHIVSKIDAKSPDGFSSMVSRYVSVKKLTDGIPDGSIKVDRGPFDRIADAIKYAHSWNDSATPPPMPEVKPEEQPEAVASQTEAPLPEETK